MLTYLVHVFARGTVNSTVHSYISVVARACGKIVDHTSIEGVAAGVCYRLWSEVRLLRLDKLHVRRRRGKERARERASRNKRLSCGGTEYLFLVPVASKSNKKKQSGSSGFCRGQCQCPAAYTSFECGHASAPILVTWDSSPREEEKDKEIEREGRTSEGRKQTARRRLRSLRPSGGRRRKNERESDGRNGKGECKEGGANKGDRERATCSEGMSAHVFTLLSGKPGMTCYASLLWTSLLAILPSCAYTQPTQCSRALLLEFGGIQEQQDGRGLGF